MHCRWLLPLLFALPLVAPLAQKPDSSRQPVRFDPKLLHAPVATYSPEAEIPDEARRKQLSGVCDLSMTVDAKGNPQDLKLLRCSDPIFSENAIAATRKYRFKPARTIEENQPVPVIITIEVTFRFPFSKAGKALPQPAFRAEFYSPQNVDSPGQAADGFYPLSNQLEKPKLVQFVDVGFRREALAFPDGTGCQLVLTLDSKGNPVDAQVTSCDNARLHKPSVDSLLQSRFAPATLNGSPVPVRATVRLTIEGFAPPHQ